jgi:DNA-binding NarL/FixJ family response regulator
LAALLLGPNVQTFVYERSPMDKNAEAIRILIADDQPIFRDGLCELLKTEGDFQVVGKAGDVEEAIRLVAGLKPNLLLLGLRMPHFSGFDILRELRTLSTPVRTVVLAAEIETAEIVEAIKLGVRGVLLKESSSEMLFECIRSVMTGCYWIGKERVSDVVQALHDLSSPTAVGAARKSFGLTPRELEIIAAIVAGYTNRDIAQKFSISEQTVKHHLTNIFDKLGVFNRLELALFAVEQGLINTV